MGKEYVHCWNLLCRRSSLTRLSCCNVADHYWVLADNDDLETKKAEDSRTFGPLHVGNILGRIIYYVRSQTEHGPVENESFKPLTRFDKAILEVELDIEKMLATKC